MAILRWRLPRRAALLKTKKTAILSFIAIFSGAIYRPANVVIVTEEGRSACFVCVSSLDVFPCLVCVTLSDKDSFPQLQLWQVVGLPCAFLMIQLAE